MSNDTPYVLRCDLTFGDIYLQVMAWMAVIFVSLAAGLALMGSSRPIFALVGVGLILVLSLPFLLFAFKITLGLISGDRLLTNLTSHGQNGF